MRIAIVVPIQLLVLFSISVIKGYVFPDDFKTCNSLDPYLNECLAEAIQDALSKLASPGIHSPINLTISKVYYPYFVITPDDSDMNTTIECFNLTYTDLWRIRVENVSVNLCKPELEFTTYSDDITAFVPRYRILRKMNEKGEPEAVQEDGVAIIRYYNVTIQHSLKFKPTERDNEKYLAVASYNIKLSIYKAKIFFGDFVEGKVENVLEATDHHDLTLEGDQKRRFEIFGGLMFRWYAGRVINSAPVNRIISGWEKACGNSSE